MENQSRDKGNGDGCEPDIAYLKASIKEECNNGVCSECGEDDDERPRIPVLFLMESCRTPTYPDDHDIHDERDTPDDSCRNTTDESCEFGTAGEHNHHHCHHTQEAGVTDAVKPNQSRCLRIGCGLRSPKHSSKQGGKSAGTDAAR